MTLAVAARTAALLLATSGLALAIDDAQQAGRYRTGVMDARVRSVPVETQQGIFLDPDRYVVSLVQSLTTGVSDQWLKAKILHDWIADNLAYDVESFLAGTQVDASWAATLRQRKGICYGYAAVMLKLCQTAGIPCTTITGYARGYRFGIGQAESPADVNHAWNAVQLDGQWRLIDVTWDAGHVQDRTFRKKYQTAYLFMEPQQFVYTHFPKDPGWQLLNPPLGSQQFLNLPYLTGTFFEHGLRLASRVSRVTSVGESVQISLEVPQDVLVMARLKTTSGTEVPRRTLVARDGRQCRVLAAFPQAGPFSLHLFAKARRDPGMFLQVGTLEFESTRGTSYSLPMTFAAYEAMDACLESPLFVPLPNDKPVEFRLRIRGTRDVQLSIGSRPWQRLVPHPTEKDVYQATATVSGDMAVKLVAKDPAGGGFTVLVDFSPSPP